MSPTARFRLFYFLYYGSVGANLPYLAVYLRGLGFSGTDIGTAQLIGAAVAAPATLAWAMTADRLRATARALRAATACAFAAMVFLPVARTPVAVGAVLLANGLFASAVVPLVDAMTVEWVRVHPHHPYARIRLFGSLGFIAVAVVLGFFLDARGGRDADLAVPVTVATCVGAYALVARLLPPASPPHGRPRLSEMTGLLRDPRLVALLVGCAVHWGACAPFHLLFGVFVRDAGLPARITGLGVFAGVGAEVVALLAFPRLESRLGLRALYLISFAVTAVRWLLLARATGPISVVAIQLLHAATFGLFWGASVASLARMVPDRLRATGQALFSAIVFGGGNAAGYWLSGIGYDTFGGVRALYAWAGAIEAGLLVGMMVVLSTCRALERATSVT
jgi:PPP family 3-phenylpropionic acid transporter